MLEEIANTRNIEVTIQNIRNPKDALIRSYYDIDDIDNISSIEKDNKQNQLFELSEAHKSKIQNKKIIKKHKPYNHQICLGICENEIKPMLTIYSEEYDKFYGITDIFKNNQIKAVDIHGKIKYWLPIWTDKEWDKALEKSSESFKENLENNNKNLRNFKENKDSYYNKTNKNEEPDHNQICLVAAEIELNKIKNTQDITTIPILAIYDKKIKEFLIIEEIHKQKTGRYYKQHIECRRLPEDITTKTHQWIPIFTAFEYYKYDKSERSKWRKTLAMKLQKENPEWSKAQLLKELNKIKPFPQVIRNVYDTDTIGV